MIQLYLSVDIFEITIKYNMGINMDKRKQDLRERLNRLLLNSWPGYFKLACEVGINVATLTSFITGKRDIHIGSLNKIELYIIKKEGEKENNGQ